MSASRSLSVQKVPLHCPALEEVAKVLEAGLSRNFEDVEVTVVDCPDLTQAPFKLAASGLSGKARVADVGGVPNLVPLVKREKVYNLESVARMSEITDGVLMGAGAGPNTEIGVNCEMMANIKVGPGHVKNDTHICKIIPQDGSYQLSQPKTTDFALLGNFYMSEGKPGKVLQVKAGKRTGSLNYMNCMRYTLQNHYGTKPVALGGTFLVGKGKVNIHVMPDFSTVPLNSDDEVDNWLRYFEMSSPLVAVGYLISHDPDLDLRIEHFHCFSQHGDGGHYHYDTTPQDVQYCGYLNIAEYMYRIDRPLDTHMIGRD